jgi:hypothetical protein
MPTIRNILNAGLPPQTPDDVVPAQEWGLALVATYGTTTSPTGFGDFLRGSPTHLTGLGVAGGSVTLSEPGAVVSVEATTAASTGPKVLGSVAAPANGTARVTYADGIPTIRFSAGDAVTVCAVVQVRSPPDLVALLEQAAPTVE